MKGMQPRAPCSSLAHPCYRVPTVRQYRLRVLSFLLSSQPYYWRAHSYIAHLFLTMRYQAGGSGKAMLGSFTYILWFGSGSGKLSVAVSR